LIVSIYALSLALEMLTIFTKP